MTTFKAFHGQVPDYIRDLLKPIEEYRPSRSLRSDNCILLSIRDFNMVHYGRRAFSHAALRLWNNIPVEIWKIDTKSEFKNELKTHLFKSYYNCSTVSQYDYRQFAFLNSTIWHIMDTCALYVLYIIIYITAGYEWHQRCAYYLKLPSLFTAWRFWIFHNKSHNMKALVILSHSWWPFLPLICLYGKITFVGICVAYWSTFLRKHSSQITHANHMTMTTSGEI